MNRQPPVSHGEIRYLYAPIRPSPARAAMPGLWTSTRSGDSCLVEKGTEFSFEMGKWSIEELSSGNHDDVKACGRFPMPE